MIRLVSACTTYALQASIRSLRLVQVRSLRVISAGMEEPVTDKLIKEASTRSLDRGAGSSASFSASATALSAEGRSQSKLARSASYQASTSSENHSDPDPFAWLMDIGSVHDAMPTPTSSAPGERKRRRRGSTGQLKDGEVLSLFRTPSFVQQQEEAIRAKASLEASGAAGKPNSRSSIQPDGGTPSFIDC